MIKIPTRPFAGRRVSAVALGCMNLSHAYGVKPSEEEAIRLLNHALDSGVTMLDTAAIYGNGDNERLVNSAVMHRRAEFLLASKCVLGMYDGERRLDGRPEAIAQTLDSALERLGTDHIDLYYMHRLDRNVPVEESMGALVLAKEAGKIGAIGLSEMSSATIRKAQAVHPIAAVQTEYSPWTRNVELGVLDTCRDLGIALVAFSPVGRGLLAGGITNADYVKGDIRAGMPRFIEPNLSQNLKLFTQFQALAEGAGMTAAQLAIGWVLARAPHIIALPGTRNIAHLDEDLGAASMIVDEGLVAAVDILFAPGVVAGHRYPPNLQAQIDTEMFPEEIAASVA